MEALLSSVAAPGAASRRCLVASELHTNSLPQRDSREAPPCAGGGQGGPEKGTRKLDPGGISMSLVFPSDSILMISHAVIAGQISR